jgi:multicomponent Na+:H+ antiporter subunit D
MISIDYILLLPFLTPLLAAILCVFFWKKLLAQQLIYLFSGIISLLSSCWILLEIADTGMLNLQVGGWKAPFGITLAADMLSALMLTASAILSFLLYFYSLSHSSISKERKLYGYYPALLFMIFGIHGALITGDIFNLYVWFEVMLIASFVLLTLGGEEEQLEGAVKYVTINFIASSLFLTAIGIMYGVAGSTNMADLSVKMHSEGTSAVAQIGLVFFVVSFGIKAALFPLFFWLPASYHTPPIAISAIIAGLLTKVGIYALFRTAIFIFPADNQAMRHLFLGLAGLTMLVGIMGAIAQTDYRKILSYLIISHMGYMVMGIGIGTHLAIAGAVYYILHSILVKANLFFVGGLIGQHQNNYQFSKGGGIYRQLPVLSFCFFVCAMSLAGIPPLTGFWGKYILAQAGLINGNYLIVGVSLATGLLTLFVVNRIWLNIFLQKEPEQQAPRRRISEVKFATVHRGMYLTVGSLSIVILTMSFFPEQVISWSETAADHLLNRELYIEKVLGSRKN